MILLVIPDIPPLRWDVLASEAWRALGVCVIDMIWSTIVWLLEGRGMRFRWHTAAMVFAHKKLQPGDTKVIRAAEDTRPLSFKSTANSGDEHNCARAWRMSN